MPNTKRYTRETAMAVLSHISYEEGIVQRNLNQVKAQATNERICQDQALVKRVVRALKRPGDHNFKTLAKEHNIPHHTIMYIWREYQ